MWAMTSFRYIVIAVEMVVMLAFLSRFWLDATNVDLNDMIKQKTSVLAASSNFEKEFKDTQKRLKIFSAFVSQEKTTSYYLKNIVSLLPTDVILVNFGLSSGTIQLKGSSYSETSVAQFVVNLESSKNYDAVAISGLDSSQQEAGLITFNLKLTPKGGKI